MRKIGKRMTGRMRKTLVRPFSNRVGFRISPFRVLWYGFLGIFGYNYYLNLFTDLPEENFGKRK